MKKGGVDTEGSNNIKEAAFFAPSTQVEALYYNKKLILITGTTFENLLAIGKVHIDKIRGKKNYKKEDSIIIQRFPEDKEMLFKHVQAGR